MTPSHIVISSILLITVFANVFPLLYVLRSDLREQSNKILLFHIIGIALWSASILFILWLPFLTHTYTFAAGSIGYKVEQIIFLSATLWISANFWFIKSITGHLQSFRFAEYAFILFQLIVFFLILIPNSLFSEVTILPQGYALLTIEPLSAIYSVFLLLHLTLPLSMLALQSWREKHSVKRAQHRILLIMYTLFFFVSVAFNWIFPVYFNIFIFNALGPTVSLIFVGGIIYAITRYEFLNLTRFIQRGVIFTALLVSIVGTYLFVIFALSYLFGTTVSTASLFSAGMVTAIGIFSVPVIERYLKNVTDSFFFKGTYNYAHALYMLSATINKSLFLREIIKQAETQLRELFRAEKVTVTIYNSHEHTPVLAHTTQSTETPNIPILLDNHCIGSIQLYEKRSGDTYTKEDIELLRTFANQIAVAVEKARLYAEVKEYSEQLERKVAERTSEIQVLNELQKQMFLNISHGLQNPLSIMKGHIELLAVQQSDTVDLKKIGTLIDDTSLFVTKLLHLAHMEREQNTYTHAHLSLSALVAEHVEFYETIAFSEGISLTSNIAKDIFIEGDTDKIREMLNNLMSNAFKYTAQNTHKAVHVALSASLEAAQLLIQDTGIGISKEDIPHIFKRFYRSEHNHEISGTGLGLSIVETIVHLHRGTIEVTSTLGKGTTFIVTFPISAKKNQQE